MFPIHLSRKLACVTKIPHHTQLRQKHRQQQRERQETAQESRRFRLESRIDFLGLPHTRLARYITNHFTIAHLNKDTPVILSVYFAKLYPSHYYEFPHRRISPRTKQTHTRRLFINPNAFWLH